MNLSPADTFARIRLLRSPGIGPVSYFQLLRRFGDAATALDALPDLAARGGGKYRPVPTERIEAEIERLHRACAPNLLPHSPAYPPHPPARETPPPAPTRRAYYSLPGPGAVPLRGVSTSPPRACPLALGL